MSIPFVLLHTTALDPRYRSDLRLGRTIENNRWVMSLDFIHPHVSSATHINSYVLWVVTAGGTLTFTGEHSI